MDLSVIYSRALAGIDAPLVQVETHLSNGLPAFHIVGLPETAVRESRDRVRCALLNSHFEFPDRRITVNLAPTCPRRAAVSICRLHSEFSVHPDRFQRSAWRATSSLANSHWMARCAAYPGWWPRQAPPSVPDAAWWLHRSVRHWRHGFPPVASSQPTISSLFAPISTGPDPLRPASRCQQTKRRAIRICAMW